MSDSEHDDHPLVRKTLPNILICGTPGTGKSRLSESISQDFPEFLWINVGEFAKENGFLGRYDETYECHELEEEPLLDSLETPAAQGGLLVDHHMPDLYPQRFFDRIFVLRTQTEILYDRLQGRGYSKKKLEDNVQCEIFQTILEEAQDSYPKSTVFELPSNNLEDFKSNKERIAQWILEWKEKLNN